MKDVPPHIVTVVGNPRLHSRTQAAAELVVRALTGREPDHRIDVGGLGAELLSPGSAGVVAAVEQLAAADLAVVASPTYKATYTGLLKLFLDHVPAGRLSTVTVVPLMLAGDPRHALAGEVHLKPLLAELGASCPTGSIFLLEDQAGDPTALDPWLAASLPLLRHLT